MALRFLKWTALPHNVKYTFAFTLFFWAGRSILYQQILAGYVFVLTKTHKDVGFVRGILGLTQLLFSLPAGYIADKTRRDLILRFSSVLGVLASGLTFFAVEHHSFYLLCASYSLWGLFAAFQNPAMEALFTDSIPPRKRSYPMMVKYNIGNIAMVLGPLCCIGLLKYYGDVWRIDELRSVLQAGTIFMVLAALLLCPLDDDQAFSSQNPTDQPNSHETSPLFVKDLLKTDPEVTPEHDASILPKDSKLTRQITLQDSAKFLCFRAHHIPWIVFTTDFIIANGAGMTITFFPLFFMQEYKLSPIDVSTLFVVLPVFVIILSYFVQAQSLRFGRMPLIAVTRLLSVFFLGAMSFVEPLTLQIVLFLCRGATMRCSQPLRRSLLMDCVPQDVRARWNALESISVFTWSGSAVLGGFLVDWYGFRICFFITACVYMVGVVLELVLLPLTKNMTEHNHSIKDEE